MLFDRHAYVADAIETCRPGRGMYSSPWHWRDGHSTCARVVHLHHMSYICIKSPHFRRVTSLGKRNIRIDDVQNLVGNL